MTEEAPRLLLVEDDPEVARAVSRSLRRSGFDVTGAPSFGSALALGCEFDLAVFDVGLGDGDGVELAQALRADGRVGPLVFFTSARGEAYDRAARVGPVVRKSDGIEALLQVLLGMLDRTTLTESAILPTPSAAEAADETGRKSNAG